MPTFASTILANAAGANTTFNPSEKTGNGSVYVYRTNEADPVLRKSISVSRSPAKSGNDIERIKVRIIVPAQVADANGLIKTFQAVANLEFVLPGALQATTRGDLRAFAAAWMNTTAALATIKDGESIY